MAGFSVKEILVRTSDGRNFTLVEPFSYTALNGEVITIPAGSTSDGASTPKALWNIIPPFGTYFLAAFLHDFLYRCTTKSKDECDNLLDEAMDSLGVPDVDSDTIYTGVHLCGWKAFRDDRTQA